jgi:AGCS family alanine or glycine:cation symporter
MILANITEMLDSITQLMADTVWSIPLFFLLLGCGLAFSVITKFVQWRVMTHGFACVRGDYDRPEDTGHINHFQALCAALSATIGLGNIAGVAIAVTLGGPGAIFWMWVVGIFGMALKFAECTLAVMYRDVRDVPDPDAPASVAADAESRTLGYQGEQPADPGAQPHARGEVRGGPMWYIQKALVDPLRAKGNPMGTVFKVLAVCFAAATILNSFGSGNMFQGWSLADVLHQNFDVPQFLSATVVSLLVAMVIIGGIKRIGQVASKLVPFMCVVYVLGALYVIITHATEIPHYLGLIVKSAFTPQAEGGAFTGVTVWIAFQWGLKRACFSNEAGEGSAAMAHAAAKTEEPVREGIVAGVGPFIDTIIICTMSALVILMSGAWNRAEMGTLTSLDGDQAVVTCNADVPANIGVLYSARVRGEDKRENESLAIHVLREKTSSLEVVRAPILEFTPPDAQSWPEMKTITLSLDPDKVSETDLERIKVGQPVHVDIEGADMTRFAFDTSFRGFGKYMVTLGVCLFAFSTMISWSYYGEKGAEYLLGAKAILPYKFAFVVFVFLGMVLPDFTFVYNFSDATVGLMVLCNLPALVILSPAVVRAAQSYFKRLDRGEFPRRK